jgi:hypothetical protein
LKIGERTEKLSLLKKSGWNVKLTTDLRLVPRLRINGAVPLFPLYAFMLWTGTTAPLVGPYIFGKIVVSDCQKMWYKML